MKVNSGNDKECRFCGVKFSEKCSVCGFPNPQAAKFCFNCGNRMANPDNFSSVENFGTLSESRKNVAVMFADISGFTSLSERLDPEEVREIINECINYITSPVYELEGTIDKYIGDCVMILFGARYIHTNDAKRAVTCAMKMMDLISEFSNNMLSSKGIRLNLSIGINYGLVVTGSVGNYFDRDYTVMGDIVNTAQRLQMSAGEGVILASESVFSETIDRFEYSEPIEVKVKNKEYPVRCYQPLKINSDYSYDKELFFIERQKEIGILNSIYNQALNTGLKCVIVTGEAGIGKTRLLKEFTSKLGNSIKKVWVDCNAISQNRSYSLISNLLTGIMSIDPMDSANTRKHRLLSFLDYIMDDYNDDEIKHTYDFLGLLMGLEIDGEFQSIFESMNYENIRRELLKQLALFFENLCRKQKLLVVADDAQWADNGSIQILNDLIPILKDIKAVFILSSRYNPEALFKNDKSYRFEIKLNPLSKTGVKDITCAFLKSQKIEEHLYNAILKLTKGNPLFIKELISNIKRKGIYSVKNGEAIIEENELNKIPENIQNLIRSNISSLDAKSLKILQAAAVIGKEFSFSMLNHLLDDSITNEEVAGIPVRMNVIALKSTHTSARIVEKTYEFTHDIEREVIYESILNKEKTRLHKKISEYLENIYSNDIENYYEALCMHLLAAGLSRKAAGYYFKTAMKLKDGFNLSSALKCFDRFLDLYGAEPANELDERIFSAHKEKGLIYFINANYNEALEQFYKALDHTGMQDDINNVKIQIAEVYKDIGKLEDASAIISELEPGLRGGNLNYGKWLQLKCNILRIKGDTGALALVKKSERAILKIGDYRSLSETMKHAGMIYFNKGDIDNALFYMNKSYRYAEKNKLLEIMAKVSGDLGIIYHSTGMITKALEFFNKSMEISKKLSYQRGVVAACINLGILYLDKGLFLTAKNLFNESLSIAREIGSKLYECVSLTNLGDIAYETNVFDAAEKTYMESLSLAKELEAPVEEGVNYIGLARIHLKSKMYKEASDLIDSAFKIFKETDEAVNIGDCYTYMGYIEQQNGLETAEGHYDKAIEIFTECRNDKKKMKAIRYKGYLLLEKGRINDALQLFGDAVSEVDRLESDYDSAKCWYAKYEALKAAGMNEDAAESLKKAGSYIKKVDDCRWTDIILGNN
jgi:class 3 adenylate cyclase/tetratricopeptide (TPR) repeat protein